MFLNLHWWHFSLEIGVYTQEDAIGIPLVSVGILTFFSKIDCFSFFNINLLGFIVDFGLDFFCESHTSFLLKTPWKSFGTYVE